MIRLIPWDGQRFRNLLKAKNPNNFNAIIGRFSSESINVIKMYFYHVLNLIFAIVFGRPIFISYLISGFQSAWCLG